MRDADTRRQLCLDENWDQLLTLETETRAFGEFEWLVSNGNMREYLLVCISPKMKTFYNPLSYDPDLDDVLPF